MTKPPVLGDDQREVLAALKRFELLTLDQMQRVGVADGDSRRLATAVRVLVRKNLVGRTEPRLIAYIDRMPSLHWITPKGADVLAEMGVEVVGSKRTIKGWREFKHRLAIVDFHIALRGWCLESGCRVRKFVADFSPGGGYGQKSTTLESPALKFAPDAYARLAWPDGADELLALEIERGGERADRKPFRDGLAHWRAVAETGHVERHLGGANRARFVFLFNSADMRRKALANWPEPTAPAWRRFYCKGLDELGGDFNAGWWHPAGGTRYLFEGGTPSAPA